MNLVDQKFAAVRRLLETKTRTLHRQGAVVATWRQARRRRLGPYYSLRYRDGRRQCSFYLGRCAELADKVRQLLARLQRPRRRQRLYARLRRLITESLRRHRKTARAEMDRFIEQHGGLLTRHGWNIRGWRRLEATMRNAAPCGNAPPPG